MGRKAEGGTLPGTAERAIPAWQCRQTSCHPCLKGLRKGDQLKRWSWMGFYIWDLCPKSKYQKEHTVPSSSQRDLP